MASKTCDHIPHFILMPLMAQGHQIPMVDMAKLLASHGVTVTIVTTPQNSTRFDSVINRAIELGLKVRILRLRFPSAEVGLPEGCESLDTIPSRDMAKNFFQATKMLQHQLEQRLAEVQPRPSCIISDRYLPWTSNVAWSFRIPRLLFDGMSCLNFVCSHNIRVSKIYEKVKSESEPFLVPNLPDQIELTKAQLPECFNPGPSFSRELHDEIDEAENSAYGLVVNTFEELEKDYLREAQKVVKRGRVWSIGPLSLCNKDNFDISHRGNKLAIDEDQILKWLDSWPVSSVIYACLGTLSALQPEQILQLGLALEASKRPFVWVIRGGSKTQELEKLIAKEGLEERTRERGLLIRGWAPQVLILSHGAVGGFLTHCGWNSVLEGVCSGVPMVTWPMFSDQFYNDRLVTQVLRIGAGVGAAMAVRWGQEDKYGVALKSEDIERAIEKVMGVGEGQEETRQRAREVSERAYMAMEKEGSSHYNVTMMIDDIMQYCNNI